MDFGKKKDKEKKKEGKGGIMDMKFMKAGEEANKKRMKAEAKMLIDQIQGDQQIDSDSEGKNKKSGFDALAAFNQGAKVDKSNQEIDQAEILKAAKELFQK